MTDATDKWLTNDLTDYDEKRTDKDKIEKHIWVPCRMCIELFMRVRLTGRYCNNCERAFCEGEHGTFRKVGVCARCYDKKDTDLA
jgi:hypothetical protein